MILPGHRVTRLFVLDFGSFDVGPGKRRIGRSSRFRDHVRFSFGPEESVLHTALVRLERIVAAARG